MVIAFALGFCLVSVHFVFSGWNMRHFSLIPLLLAPEGTSPALSISLLLLRKVLLFYQL